MGQRKQLVKKYNNRRGILTESSLLEFPIDASTDEENFELKRNGERHRRDGMDYETLHTKIRVTAGANAADELLRDGVVNTFTWTSVAGIASLDFLVLQIGHFIKFHVLSNADDSISTQVKGFEIDLRSYKGDLKINQKTANCTFARGLGQLYIASSEIYPLVITYVEAADTITVTTHDIQIRDFGDAGSGAISIDATPVASDINTFQENEQIYNLRNRGWAFTTASLVEQAGSSVPTVVDPIQLHVDTFTTYPSKSDVFSRARASAVDTVEALNAFSPWEVAKHRDSVGRSAPRGNKLFSGIERVRFQNTTLSPTVPEAPPSSVAFFAGRLFYGSENKVYYSQLGIEIDNLLRFYQANSPTDELDSLLVATDGGEQPIPDMGPCNALIPAGKNLFAFSEQGIWVISGADSTFSATSVSISRITDLPVRSARSVVVAESEIYFVSDAGIYRFDTTTLSQGQVPKIINITEDTIQTRFLEIGAFGADNMQGIYNKATRKVQWLYNASTAEAAAVSNRSKVDQILIFDIALGSFNFYTLKDTVDQTVDATLRFDAPDIYGAFLLPGNRSITKVHDVVDALGNPYLDGSSNQIVANIATTQAGTTSINYIVGLRDNFVVSGETYYTMGSFLNTDFKEWDSHNQEPASPLADVDAAAFMMTGFDLQDNPMNMSEVGYLRTFMNETTGDSGCKVTELFDWALHVPDGGVTGIEMYQTGISAPVREGVTKILGRGKSVGYLFQSVAAKDCQLLGWAYELETNTNT